MSESCIGDFFGTFREMETAEVVAKLKRECSRPDIIAIMLDEQHYTKKGRLNRSSVCRAAKISASLLEKILQEMRMILLDEYEFLMDRM